MTPALEEAFRGTERFEIRRRLGAGAYGVVYEAFDRQRGAAVALKTLRAESRDALYRLKSEFRALADITHPNLVKLHEMLAEDGQWFVTMELIDGTSFLSYVRSSPRPDVAEKMASTVSECEAAAESAGIRPRLTPEILPRAPFDERRLREALRQAVLGASALHAAGKLHRDIKPSNVLVTREGRLVLLDFGLVKDLASYGSDGSASIVGTPAYMSPEQGAGAPVSEKSDWYSLGVMLYEALTGVQPFAGPFGAIMREKWSSEPKAPKALVGGVSEDLNALCADLLRRDPKARPSGEEILRRLAGSTSSRDVTEDAPSISAGQTPFVGRGTHLAALRDAFDTSRRGQAVTIYLHGTSGIGKSALARRFLEEVRQEDAVVLAGRCYERESTPYKALDSLVDSLSHYLKGLPAEQTEALLPRDILALARVFPVLRRVEAVAGARRKIVEIADSFELRRRAFAALRELLAKLAVQRDVVLFIDDLQWGDIDSAALLEELMRPPDAPALLLIGAYRSEEAETSPLLQRLLKPGSTADSGDTRSLAVEELEASDARELAMEVLRHEGATDEAGAAAIARESAGNPFFIQELARLDRAGSRQAGTATLDDMVRARVLLLPEEARRLLQIVSIAGQPVDSEIAERAAAPIDAIEAVLLLRSEHLIRIRVSPAGQEIEPYHDRIREVLVAQLPSETLKDHHQRLASALESSGRADPEQLALHFHEAGETDRAQHYAESAADHAAETLAFDRAARFYRMALESGASATPDSRRNLQIRLARALANAGRGAEAGRAFLAAAEGAPRARALQLDGWAAGQFLRAGHVDQALPIFERVFGRVGQKFLQPTWRSLAMCLLVRALIRLRGLGFRERDESQIPPEQLIRLDTYWLLASGLVLVNSIRARENNHRFVLLALRVGEPSRAAVALSTQIAVAALVGWRQRKRADAILAQAIALAERVNDPRALGLAHTYGCAGALILGRFGDCIRHGQEADRIYRERCTGVTWELDFTNTMWLRGLYYRGALRELFDNLPTLIREAKERDDLLAVVGFQIRHSYVRLLADDEPLRARENLKQLLRGWSQKAFSNQHYYALVAECEIALFEGDGRAAWATLEQRWRAFRRSGLIRAQYFRLEALHLRARTALAAAIQAGSNIRQREFFLAAADRDSRRVERERAPWGAGLAKLARAGVAATQGDAGRALGLVEDAEKSLESLDMALYAAAAHRRRGQLLGGDEGAALVAEADAWMAGQDIRNPARMADMLAPGRWS